jgi:hypothetical protein
MGEHEIRIQASVLNQFVSEIFDKAGMPAEDAHILKTPLCRAISGESVHMVHFVRQCTQNGCSREP